MVDLELDDDTLVKDLPMTCPQCDCHFVIVGIAHWMRDVPEYSPLRVYSTSLKRVIDHDV